MTIFSAIARPTFTATPKPKADVPAPFRGKSLRRRQLAFKECQEVLATLPGPGESLHCITSGRWDLCLLLVALIKTIGKQCRHLRIATLSFSRKNTAELAHLLRSGQVGTTLLLCSAFFRDHSQAEYEEAKREADGFPTWKIAAARNHAKLACLDFEDGPKVVVESSANLRSNGNVEQVVIIVEPELHDWYAAWIDGMVAQHEAEKGRPKARVE